MSNRHHPTWAEIRAHYLSDPEVAEAYAPAPRDRTAERTRCDSTIPGYREAREAG